MHPVAGRPPVLLTLLAALAGHAWVLDLPFRLDDVTLIPVAGAELRNEMGMVLGGGSFDDLEPVPPGDRHRFRPLLRMTLVAEQFIQDPPLSPKIFYATSLALHGITSVVLLIGLRRILPGGAAFGGAVLFALHPAGSQALTSIAARADILVTLCALLSWLCCQLAEDRPAKLRWPGLAGLALAGAIMAGEPAFSWIPVLIGILVWHRRRARHRTLGLSAFLLPVATVLFWRQACLGACTLVSLTGEAASPADSGSLMSKTAHLLTWLLVPWKRSAATAGSDPWLAGVLGHATEAFPAAFAVAMLFMVLSASLYRPRQAGLGVLLAVLALACVLAPAASEFVPGQTHAGGQTFYPAMPLLAFLFAATAASLAAAGRTRRAPRAILAAGGLVFAIASLDALVHTARVEKLVGHQIKDQVERVEAEARKLPQDGVVLVAGPQGPFSGTSVLGERLQDRFRQPFRDRALDVRHYATMADVLTGARGLRKVKPVVVILEEQGDSLVLIAGPLPSIPGSLPGLVRAGTPAIFRPEADVPMRALAGMKLFLPAEASGSVRIVVRSEGDEIHFLLDTAPAEPPNEHLVFFDVKPELALSPRLREVEIEGLDAAGDGLLPPLLLDESPLLRLVEPAEGARWRLRDRLRFVFRSPVEAERYRVEFQIVLTDFPSPAPVAPSMVYEFPRTALEVLPGGLLSWPPFASQLIESASPELRLENIPDLFHRLARPAGIWDITLRWRAMALGPDGRSHVTRSAWSSFTYVPD